jgi:hypothetical protein
MKFIWTGPSWAARSFDPPEKQKFIGTTNLALEWGFSHFDASGDGTGIILQQQKVLLFPKNLPVIWVYPEPLADLTKFVGLSHIELLKRNDWIDIRKECNDQAFKKINSLGRPVLLIGGHSDVVDFK